jgi:phage-related protein
VQLELAPAITTESVTIVDEIRNFGEGNPQPQQNENIYQNYYVNQVSGVKRMGVPYTI